MIRYFYIVTLLLLAGVATSYGQATLKGQVPPMDGLAFPSEEVYIHYNSTLLFAGEYLYYKVYALQGENHAPSTFSKVAYVALIGEDRDPVFIHKIHLKNGTGQGDFFIPTDVASGNYKLVGYTNWMRNYDSDLFFQDAVTVINPYLGDQNAIRAEQLSEAIKSKPELPVHTSRYLKMSRLQDTYGKRKEVSFFLDPLQENKENAVFSISVRKIDPIAYDPQTTFETFQRNSAVKGLSEKQAPRKVIYLPELRGELITGKLTTTVPGQTVQNKKISFSTPGSNYLAKIVTTDSKGNFTFQIKEPYTASKGLVQLMEDAKEGYQIQVDEVIPPDFSSLVFKKFQLTPAMKEKILQRSVYNQIENAYFTVKPDTIRSLQQRPRFYNGRPVLVFDLDDYTRFRTMEETMIEIVNFAGIRTDKNGQDHFFVRPYELSTTSELPPMVIVDGIILPDHSLLSNYDPLKVKSISVVRDKYYYGSQVFQGILDVVTIDGDFQVTDYKPYEKWVALDAPQPVKTYFQQQYSGDSTPLKRIPDFRDQLLWMPNVTIPAEGKEISLYTSDNEGTYEVIVEGMSPSGTPVSLSETFVVN